MVLHSIVDEPGAVRLEPGSNPNPWDGRQSLHEAQNLNTLILNSSRDCIVVMDTEGNTRFVSQGGIEAMEITDLPSIIGLSWLRVWKDEADNRAARAAVAEARAGRIGRFKGFCATHKGRPKWWDVMISPLSSPDGEVQQLVSIGRDITETREAEQRLALSEAALRLATEAAEIGTWDLDLKTDVLDWSDRTKALFGIAPGSECSMADFYSGLHPDDFVATAAAFATAIDPAIRATYDVEYRTVGRDDGIVRWVAAKGRGVFQDGKCVRAIGTAIDVGARKASEERQRLLAHELSHRMKNTLAMVQAIANQTMRNSATVPEARLAFGSRLAALGRAQDILTQTSWTAATIGGVAAGVLGLHGGDGPRFAIEGPDLVLGPKCALAFSLALHELATNAAKYGALSNGEGHVAVRWKAEASESGQRFRFEWRESGGPPVNEPERRGFGSRMLEGSLAGYFQGVAETAYEPAGLVFSLDAPLSALTDA